MRPALAAVLLPLLAAWSVESAQAEDFDQAARQARAGYLRGLEDLAQWCAQQGLTEQAKKTRSLAGPAEDPFRRFVPILPKQVGTATVAADAPAPVQEWDARLTRLRRDQANTLFDLARRAVRGGRISLGYELLLAALYAQPDHETIRRLLGYQKLKGQWCTQYEAAKQRAGQTWSPQFGWIPQAHLARYQQGKRPSGTRWITVAEDARLHQDIPSGWTVETEHYQIRTNHSLEAGVALGVKLERLYSVWQQLFIRYYATEAQLLALFEGKTAAWTAPRFLVVYFRDKADYIRTLKPVEPQIAITTGFYWNRKLWLYHSDAKKADDRNLFHEATHQLFSESRAVVKDLAQRANMWVLEGIAMYMESLREEQGFYVLGGFQDERMYAAAYRLLKNNFYVPLSELTCFGMDRLQQDPRIATLYSQSAGLTHFLMHAERGRYRDALVDYLIKIYSGRDEPGTLAVLTGVPYGQLDQQYRAFVEAGVKTLPPSPTP